MPHIGDTPKGRRPCIRNFFATLPQRLCNTMSEKQIVEMWVSKYALSSGVTKCEFVMQDDDRYAFPVLHGKTVYTTYHVGKDCHEKFSDAVAQSEKMRDKKIASLKKQIAKLEQMEFTAS